MRLLYPAILTALIVIGCERQSPAAGNHDPAGAGGSSWRGGDSGGFFATPTTDGEVTHPPEPTILRFELSRAEDAAAACTWRVPDALVGRAIDVRELRLVDVRDGGVDSLHQIGSSAECGQAGAWYLDDPESPRLVILCPGTCHGIDGTLALDLLPYPISPQFR